MISLENLYQADRGICFWCQKKVKRGEATREHVWPKVFGGPNTRLNLKLAHRICNRRRVPEEFWEKMRLEDDCWIFGGEDIQQVRNFFKRTNFELTFFCGTSNCVRPDHMSELLP